MRALRVDRSGALLQIAESLLPPVEAPHVA
jgi:hypothetical protein